MSGFQPIDLARISLDAGTSREECRTSSLIFFITGNPGLIGYYTTYLNTLEELLHPIAKQHSAHIHIYGQSLAGFADDSTSKVAEPYSLEKQVQLLQESLEQRFTESKSIGKQYDNIILIGHSVGSYILLELIRKTRSDPSAINVAAGILLFPTITHIAQSPSGVDISRLFKWQNAPERLGGIVRRVLSLLPENLLVRLVRLVTRMPSEFAKITSGFLISRMGVWQALHMARDEMQTITDDKWDEDIWGAESDDVNHQSSPAKLIFYFGQNDHWVADHTRDALIAARGRSEGAASNSKPVMIIDQDKIPHGFCIHHGEIVAEKTTVWIEGFLWSK